MHKLVRGQAPACLSKYRHGLQQWSDISPAEKNMLWIALSTMQGQRCAYCEAAISDTRRHIEHFQQRSRAPALTFAWPNLFGSCNRQDSCGKYKDAIGHYDPADLIKPDVDDPEHFFLFVSDGTIAVRAGLNANERHRAQETLRILNLDAQHGVLRAKREQAIRGYLETGHTLRDMFNSGDCSRDDVRQLLDTELSASADLPFCSAIKHALSP